MSNSQTLVMENLKSISSTEFMLSLLGNNTVTETGQSEKDFVRQIYDDERYSKFKLPPRPTDDSLLKFPRQWLVAYPSPSLYKGDFNYLDVAVTKEIYLSEVSSGGSKGAYQKDSIIADGEYRPIAGTLEQNPLRSKLFERIGRSAILESEITRPKRGKTTAHPISAIEISTVGQEVTLRLFVANSLARVIDRGMFGIEHRFAPERVDGGILKLIGMEALYRAQQSKMR